jgi:tripartite-type tricarboxylate transporter receptor subunit TctC
MFDSRAALAASLALALFALAGPAPALAQTAADKPVKLIVPLPPGGPVDAVGRQLAIHLARELRQNVIVENVAGAYGSIGLMRLARAEPDGTTIGLAASGMLVIAPLTEASVSYDPFKDFSPLSTTSEYVNVLVVNPALPVKTVAELVAYGRANPSAITYASSGNGASNHLSGELLKKMAGVPMLHVPYKGTAPAQADVLGGHASMMFDVVSTAAPLIRAGKVRALATTGEKRNASMPDVPTVAETIPGYKVTGWFALFGPPGLSGEAAHKLQQAIARALQTPEFKAFQQQSGLDSVSSTPAELTEKIRDDIKVWGPVIEAAGLRKK